MLTGTFQLIVTNLIFLNEYSYCSCVAQNALKFDSYSYTQTRHKLIQDRASVAVKVIWKSVTCWWQRVNDDNNDDEGQHLTIEKEKSRSEKESHVDNEETDKRECLAAFLVTLPGDSVA